jgi:carbonic anhydrase
MKSDIVNADEALKRLTEGNKRYVVGKFIRPHQTSVRRAELIDGQHPFAIVLGCSDSRIPVELVFDQGVGDLFVVRVAGNIADDVALGSIEYAAAHLHVPLAVVMGHGSCGAVAATASGGELEGHLPVIATAIRPAVDKVKTQQGDLVNNAARANAVMVAEKLKSSKPVLSELVRSGKLTIVAAFYDIKSGKVEFI